MVTSTERQPGLSTDRLEAFSDGVFAVAITLLIFGIATPHVGNGRLGAALLHQWPEYASYVVTFLTIGIIWVNHHATFDRIAFVDRPLLFINLLLLMTVCFIPFPTALLSDYILDGDNARVAAAIYALTMTVMSVAFSFIWGYALRRGLVQAPPGVHLSIRDALPRFSVGLFVYLTAVILALFSPVASLALCGIIAVYYVFDQQRTPQRSEAA